MFPSDFALTRRKLLLLVPAAAAARDYRAALPGYSYSFPRDHFSHPDFRTEWWYYTGNVNSREGRRFGFELVFFRQSQDAPESPSVWRPDQVYLAHAALTDPAAGRFLYRHRLNRAGPGIAGAAQGRVWNGNWSAVWQGETQTLTAVAADFRFHLRLEPAKPHVIHGRNGVSQKAGGEGKASHYVSFPRLRATGEIRTDRSHTVSGSAWMDHEWFTHQLESNQQGWDWFSIQLEGNRELMLFQLRRKDGTIDPYSAGTYIDEGGRTRHLTASDFRLTPLRRWKSTKTQANYPIEWRIQIPARKIDLYSRAILDAQELVSEGKGPSYWEGAVDYTGTAKGVGYLEMTGYAEAVTL